MVVSTDAPRGRARPRGRPRPDAAPCSRPAAARDGFGQVGAAAARHGLLARRACRALHRFETDASKSFFVLDREACILCGRCTVACDDVQQIGAISLLGRGHAMKVGVFGDGPMSSSVCTSCGQCVATCPTGALRPKEAPAPIVARRSRPRAPTAAWAAASRSACATTSGSPSWPTTCPPTSRAEGMLCVKGRFGTGFVHARDRITDADGQARRPLARGRRGTRRSTPPPTGWRATAAASARSPRPRPPTRTATSSRSSARVVMGTNNVDHCTRLCHSPSVEAMLVSMGSGATSNSYQSTTRRRAASWSWARTPPPTIRSSPSASAAP